MTPPRIDACSIAADREFWPTVAGRVLVFAAAHEMRARDLRAVQVIVPAWSHASCLRSALQRQIGAAFVPPRVAVWPKGFAADEPPLARQAELFAALRGNAWVRESFGAQPAALWSLARGISQLCDELTWAAATGADSEGDFEEFSERLQASLARHFHRRAARVLQPQAQLVLQMWRVRRSVDDGAVRALRELTARADANRAPLVYVAERMLDRSLEARLDQATDQDLRTWERALLRRLARHAPVLLIEPDVARAAAMRPLLAAAWPEVAGADSTVPIATRATTVPAATVPLAIVGANSLEEEATAAAQQVLQWHRAGVQSIALVALDRLTARRTRALLERAQVLVRDEIGWKLSTTSAAAAVMRWFDLVIDDLYWRDLLDWLKSPFTLADRAAKANEIAAFEQAVRTTGALQGARAFRRAIGEGGAGGAAATAAHAGAREVLALIEAQVQRARRAAARLGAHTRALHNALVALGMRTALARDPVGASVLRELDMLESELSPVAGRASLADFRALLAQRFEQIAFIDSGISSPVVMVSLATARLRPFDAALLIGADAQHLPQAPAEFLFMSNAVRAELGLATGESAQRAHAAQLVSLLATVPRVFATWRQRHGDEANSLSPLLERLRFVAAQAAGDDLLRRPERAEFAVAVTPTQRPAPSAPQLLPARLSVSNCQSLVDCAYQFYARRLLQLKELEDVIEVPDKREFGRTLHDVLLRFHAEWQHRELQTVAAADLVASLQSHARAEFDPQIERTPAMLSLRRRFEGLITGYIEWLQERSDAGWRWSAGEESVACEVSAPGGRPVGRTTELRGRIDRIDRRRDGATQVLDYKARAADDLRSGLSAPGEDVQLPLYGLLVPAADSAAYLSFDRARDGDPGVKLLAPRQAFGPLVAAVSQRLQVDLQRIAQGASLPAIGAATVCAKCEMRGLCRRDFWEFAAAERTAPQDVASSQDDREMADVSATK